MHKRHNHEKITLTTIMTANGTEGHLEAPHNKTRNASGSAGDHCPNFELCDCCSAGFVYFLPVRLVCPMFSFFFYVVTPEVAMFRRQAPLLSFKREWMTAVNHKKQQHRFFPVFAGRSRHHLFGRYNSRHKQQTTTL